MIPRSPKGVRCVVKKRLGLSRCAGEEIYATVASAAAMVSMI
jgi:hypothetical protein